MKKNASVGAMIGGLIVAAIIVFFLYQHFMRGPVAIHTAPPSFIDPATGRPKGLRPGMGSSVSNSPGPSSGGAPSGAGGPAPTSHP